MHAEAFDWVARHTHGGPSVCDLGSYDVNGTVKALFPGWRYVGVDLRAGPNVDVAADAATWDGDGEAFDVVVCCEALEHAADWRAVVRNACRLLKDKGTLIVTAAGPGREPHTRDGHPWNPDCGEPYQNIDPDELRAVLYEAYFCHVTVSARGPDVRAVARRVQ